MITTKKASQLVSENKICTDSYEISGFFTPFYISGFAFLSLLIFAILSLLM